MTNEELISKIKAEIERLKEENNNIRCDYNKAYCQGYGDALVDLFSFLSTLESEKPVPADLEEAADEYEKEHTYQRYDGGGLTPEYDATLAEAFIVGYKFHADHTPLPEDTVLFNKGVAEGKRLMMMEAVDTVVSLDAGGFPFIEFGVGKFGLKVGDKVRIIIVKENEQC